MIPAIPMSSEPFDFIFNDAPFARLFLDSPLPPKLTLRSPLTPPHAAHHASLNAPNTSQTATAPFPTVPTPTLPPS